MAGLPPERLANQNDTQIENFVPRPGGPIQNVAFYQVAGDLFFETLGIPLIEGRYFDGRDGFGAPSTVIVNQTMARAYWSGASALGRRVKASGSPEWLTIVGVVSDLKNAGLDKPAAAELFFSLATVEQRFARRLHRGADSRRSPHKSPTQCGRRFEPSIRQFR